MKVTPAGGNPYWYAGRDKLTQARFTKITAVPPGYYNNPPYSNDHSWTYMRFIISNALATPAQIKAEVANQGVTLQEVANWSDIAVTISLPVVHVPNVHPYMGLWAQFVNRGYGVNGIDSAPPQEITQYGGNSNFIVDTVEHYPGLDA